MFKPIHLILLLALVMLMAIGCSNAPGPTESMSSGMTGQLSFVLPEGAELNSAEFFISVREASGQNINIHRVTSAWEEMTVTWNSHGNAFAPEVYGTYMAAAPVYYGTDITDLVVEWLSGEYPNYGLLLDQNDLYYPWTIHFAREVSWASPYLRLCYTIDGEDICEDIYPVADAYVGEGFPDNNFGSTNVLYTGAPREGVALKRSLLQFEIEGTFEDGCTGTIGYWKNWTGFGPQPDMVTALLPIWLGTAGGDKSLAVTDAQIAVDVLVMKTYGKNNNGITKLYAQLLAAKLNFASGAGSDAVDDIVSDADAFLADHDWTDWEGLSEEDAGDVGYWHETLDNYNNGFIGPGHCVDDDEEEEEEDDD